MLKNEDLYARYGEDIVFLFKGDEPYVEAYGHPLGVLIEKDNKVLCNECETFHKKLGPHVLKHDMTLSDYREKYGFNKTAPLCSCLVSETASRRVMRTMLEKPLLWSKAVKALAKGRKTMKLFGKKGSYKGEHKRMQELNKRNACPEQMKQRYLLLINKYGEGVSRNIIDRVDSALSKYARVNFGSWNTFKQSLGLKVTPHLKDKADLIYDLRDYVSRFNHLPWNGDSEILDIFPHSTSPYKRVWGSMSRALLACGISSGNEWLTINNGALKKKFFLVN